jgi:hypothetical protein
VVAERGGERDERDVRRPAVTQGGDERDVRRRMAYCSGTKVKRTSPPDRVAPPD